MEPIHLINPMIFGSFDMYPMEDDCEGRGIVDVHNGNVNKCKYEMMKDLSLHDN